MKTETTATSQTTKHIACYAMKSEHFNESENCPNTAQIHDYETDVNLCEPHRLHWFAGHYMRSLGFRSERVQRLRPTDAAK